jgi:hypothetical protein
MSAYATLSRTPACEKHDDKCLMRDLDHSCMYMESSLLWKEPWCVLTVTAFRFLSRSQTITRCSRSYIECAPKA